MDQSLMIYDQIVKCNGTEKAVAQIAAIVHMTTCMFLYCLFLQFTTIYL